MFLMPSSCSSITLEDVSYTSLCLLKCSSYDFRSEINLSLYSAIFLTFHKICEKYSYL